MSARPSTRSTSFRQVAFTFAAALVACAAFAQSPGPASVTGVVLDPLGARVAGASVSLAGDAGQETTSDAQGTFSFQYWKVARWALITKELPMSA